MKARAPFEAFMNSSRNWALDNCGMEAAPQWGQKRSSSSYCLEHCGHAMKAISRRRGSRQSSGGADYSHDDHVIPDNAVNQSELLHQRFADIIPPVFGNH